MSAKFGLFKLSLLVISVYGICALDFNYHKYEVLTEVLTNFSSKYPKLSSRMYSIGKSVQNRSLWVVEVTAHTGNKIGVPNVKLIGNIHGNEPVGRELLVHFLEYLGDSHKSDATVTWLLENTRIHVLPSMNPDGFEISIEGNCRGAYGRENANKMDLNRNFPDLYCENRYPRQPESTAIQSWMKDVPFILSASIHGGALVANYPFDTVKEMTSLRITPPSETADNDVFIHLAEVYAKKHPTMHKGEPCPTNLEESEFKSFPGGITNGAAWYSITGGMQDFNYFKHGCMELTLEISCCKYPPPRELKNLWEANKYALLDFIKQAHMGVRGIIYNNQTLQPVSSASLKISGRDMNFTTSKNGEFWRILLPGKYHLEVNAKGYHPENITFDVPKYTDAFPKLTTLHIPLINRSYPRSTVSSTESTIRITTTMTSTENFLLNDLNNYLEHESDQSREEDPILGFSSYNAGFSVDKSLGTNGVFLFVLSSVLPFLSY